MTNTQHRPWLAVAAGWLLLAVPDGCATETSGPCSKDADCEAGQHCGTRCSRCATPAAEGAPGVLDGGPEESKRENGAFCSSAAVCASGFCSDGVCCDSACSAASACVDGPLGSTLTTQSCKQGRCAATAASCGPYTCNASNTDCRASCASHAECASGLCDLSDLFGTRNHCLDEAKVCYVDASQQGAGSGTRHSPHATIEDCLTNSTALHIAIADGTYDEHLSITRNAALWGVSAPGAWIQHGRGNAQLLKVVIRGSVAVLPPSPSASDRVLLRGLRFAPPPSGGYPKSRLAVVDIETKGTVRLQTVSVEAAGLPCVLAAHRTSTANAFTVPLGSVTVEDASLIACAGEAVSALVLNLAVRRTGIGWMPDGSAAVSHLGEPGSSRRPGLADPADLTLEEVHIGHCGTKTPLVAGVWAAGSNIRLDRLRIANSNLGRGIRLSDAVAGSISNAQVSGAGIGLSTETVTDAGALTLFNNTFYNNTRQVRCGSRATTTLYNSILWRDDGAPNIPHGWTGVCEFHNSVVQTGFAMPPTAVPGSNNASTAPLFATVDVANPFLRLTPDSPCKDHGTSNIPGVSPFPAKDLVNAPRIAHGQVDCGALEMQ